MATMTWRDYLKIGAAILLGVPVIAVAALCKVYQGPIHDSIKPGHGKIDYWSWQWMNYWWANTEDGNGLYAVVNGAAYRTLLPSWMPDWMIVFAWSAWRNNANNLKRPFRNDSWLPPGALSVWVGP